MLLCRLRPWHMCHWSMYSTFNSFDLPSSWTWITMPSGGNPIRGSPTRSYPRAQPHPHHPLIWIKILEASWLMAFNHFDVPLKQTSSIAHATLSLCWSPQLALREKVVCFCCLSVWAGLTDVVHGGQIFMHDWITYRRKRAFLSLCSFPWSFQPHTRTCRHPPAGNMGFPARRWLFSCPLS